MAKRGRYYEATAAFQRGFIREALLRHNGHRKATAKDLGIHPAYLFYLIRKLGLTSEVKDELERKRQRS